jgi:hypothetical protein
MVNGALKLAATVPILIALVFTKVSVQPLLFFAIKVTVKEPVDAYR